MGGHLRVPDDADRRTDRGRIHRTHHSDEVIMSMHNVIPRSEATHEISEGPYVVMEAHWRKP